ncbi:MAG: ISC system 2Fe-2S type ferredoxin [Methylacidiphilales bacterium]|nr:ISC system 2Fe-2S type ferredoxin [Candidatus Methylacidiphilales bacterium]
MNRISILPHPVYCPQGIDINQPSTNSSLLDISLSHGIKIEHACEKVCACTTCHVFIREGLHLFSPPTDLEDDMLDRAWGLESVSRLSCQAIYTGGSIIVEIPKYSINHAQENK